MCVYVQAVSQGDQNAAKSLVGKFTTDNPGYMPPVMLMPGLSITAIDVYGSITGRPNALMVPIKPCVDDPIKQ